MKWNFEKGILTIGCDGDMPDFDFCFDEDDGNGAPWRKLKDVVTDVIIESGTTSIGDFAFEDFRHISNVILPKGLRSIGREAFCGCVSLCRIRIPESVTEIGELAFESTGITHLKVPLGLSHLPYLSSNIRSVFISDGVETLDPVIFTTLASAAVSLGNNHFVDVGGGDIYSADMKTLLFCNRSASRLIVPHGVTEIGDYACFEHESLVEVHLPDTVRTIGKKAFYSCSNLRNVVVDKSPAVEPAACIETV